MKNGLDDVVAAETVLSDVDGEAGRLIIRGAWLDDLAGSATFEDTALRLWDRFFEEPMSAVTLKTALGRARVEVFAHIGAVDEAILSLPPVDALRALLARLPDGDDLPTAVRLAAATAAFLPALLRLQQDLLPIAPDATLSQAADTLRMLTGTTPSPAQVAALDAYLVTICDHGLNASTFTSRVVASTGAGLASAVLAALSALKGPLHGGAPGPVLDMLDEIGTESSAETWLRETVGRGERLMGFGHRIYKVRDPRAEALKAALQRLAEEGTVNLSRVKLAEVVERMAVVILRERKPDRRLDVNVEFYTALLLDALGFPRESFTGVFALGRTVGWIAHAREQAMNGRLIRPRSVYVGPQPDQQHSLQRAI
ncbi:citrate synthase/methylcitrate synthase [Neorhizobium sp. SOG26]|uniref:citrate synthase/methylcitrate synthase n=1 Tax=Neorhizobium sp. SOG26 TaxID=2060726 RepID=UPI000E57F0DF|nr:citrate synthase/methylcitrate synthase [Neorhizobium sp. SOG26]AXV17304.1 citrate synthase/methylcitrate synthase [Neorhizobium sp. SOG26]